MHSPSARQRFASRPPPDNSSPSAPEVGTSKRVRHRLAAVVVSLAGRLAAAGTIKLRGGVKVGAVDPARLGGRAARGNEPACFKKSHLQRGLQTPPHEFAPASGLLTLHTLPAAQSLSTLQPTCLAAVRLRLAVARAVIDRAARAHAVAREQAVLLIGRVAGERLALAQAATFRVLEDDRLATLNVARALLAGAQCAGDTCRCT